MAYSRPSIHQPSSSLYPWDTTVNNASFDSYLQLDPFTSVAPALAPAPSRTPSASAQQSYSFHSDRHPRLASASWEPDLYRIDDPAASSSPLSHATLSPSPAPAPTVKEEDTQDDFVLETPLAYDVNHASSVVFNSMTEVPLRATGACREMRKLMGVFRLDPFTAHGSIRNPDPNIAWNGEPIGPLREKPHLIEFQITMPGSTKRESTPLAVDEDLPTESSYGTPDMRRGATPYLTGHSPCPSLGYPYDDSSSIDSHPQLSSHNSSKWSPPPMIYSPQLVDTDASYTVLTPAQAHVMDQQTAWTTKYPSIGGHQHIGGTSSGDSLYSSTGSHVSLRTTTSHPAQSSYMSSLSTATSPSSITSLPPKTSSMQQHALRPSITSSMSAPSSSYPPSYTAITSSYSHAQPQARLAYRTSSPVRLPPPVSSRYPMHDGMAADAHMSSHGPAADAGFNDDGSSGSWLRKSVSLAGSFYGLGPSLSSSNSKPGLRV